MLVKDCDELEGKYIQINPISFYRIYRVLSDMLFVNRVEVSHYFNSYTTFNSMETYTKESMLNFQVVDELPRLEEKEYTL